MPNLIDVNAEPIKSLLPILLQDKTTKKNIIWATDIYSDLGSGYTDKDQLTTELLSGDFTLQPRILKTLEEQQQRTRTKAEVMTPVWICNRMNNYLDEQWFDRSSIFNHENEDHSWIITEDHIIFETTSWQSYVDSRRLEITCGEAPYLVSRYDTTTGEIIPLSRRIGILDRKLRIVNENTETEEEWLLWAERAIEASYGYEYQGDSLLIARINILLTYWEYYHNRWKKEPQKALLQHISNIITWNIWQMDGLKDTVPSGKPFEAQHQITLVDLFTESDAVDSEMALPCQVHNWREKTSVSFMDCKRGGLKMSRKLFDYVIGNPPYQAEVQNEGDRANPVYDKFMDATYMVAECVELIHPARFLFNAGQTSKAWNEKMLNDEHFKVLLYEPDARVIFPNTDIKGGVAVTIRHARMNYGAIKVFAKFEELNSIIPKIENQTECYFDQLVSSRGQYRFSQEFYIDYPNASQSVGQGSGNMIVSNAFDSFTDVFTEKPVEDDLLIIGRTQNRRKYKYIRRRYVLPNKYIDAYKVVMAEANGTGQFGETLSTPFVSNPGEGATDTFISIGPFESKDEAENALSYIKTKFARALLGINKATQHNPRPVWKSIPVQNFSFTSDIDWSKSVHDIDCQLYHKYRLTSDEIAFIESHVKEME